MEKNALNGKSTHRIASIDALRGLAALAVCFYHFTNAQPLFALPPWLKNAGSFGSYGVSVFFVISGFIIPYSLQRSGFELKNWPTFLWRRILRLEPPYLAAIVLILVLGYGLSVLNPAGDNSQSTLWQLFLHVGYLNAFFGEDWLNPVFWTLAIEFQYYLLVAFIYLGITHKSGALRTATIAALGISPFLLPNPQLVFRWLPLFMLGMMAFQLKARTARPHKASLLMAACALLCWIALDSAHLIAGLLTVLVICKGSLSSPVLMFCGTISYSLYLVHVPVGMRVINLGARVNGGLAVNVAIIAAAFAASIGAAYLLWRFVECPAQKWSAAAKLRNTSLKEATA